MLSKIDVACNEPNTGGGSSYLLKPLLGVSIEGLVSVTISCQVDCCYPSCRIRRNLLLNLMGELLCEWEKSKCKCILWLLDHGLAQRYIRMPKVNQGNLWAGLKDRHSVHDPGNVWQISHDLLWKFIVKWWDWSMLLIYEKERESIW